ncbi:MAG: Eco57I restriction-modification methylase domain-containing protein, partial [Desulfobacterales bacterium]|nr:Eco57I restriction-modification methylase domain-containing protein [Desulfobacterales bacterium]
PELDALKLPNSVFCEQNQGQSSKRLLQYPKTLLYFSTRYNFGLSDKGGGRTLTLTAMGRIFEQSITDLEVMEAHADGRESLAELTKRKRDGVYYTPEWVTHYIVEETVGSRLSEIRNELGFDKFTDVTDSQIKAYQKDRRSNKMVGEYEIALRQYGEKLDKLKVVDPACGSGAFLIQAFKYLYEQRQWIARELVRVTGEPSVFDMHSNMRSVLSENIYGVDINAESVEITRLALWLHTALPNQPLTSLDKNIRCGNSLIGHDFYAQMKINRKLIVEDERERINTFDWKEAFPEVFDHENPGFDCVIGNPPYVKLQHFRKIQEDVAKYLVEAKREDGNPLYESTQTGNFDMYLPFIERSVELLNRQGKMGFIAPNVWLVNQYGKGLRQKLKRTRQLDRWIDFKSFQVFDEAITYTALQLFSGSEQDHIRCVFAPGGRRDIASLDWGMVKDSVLYLELPNEESWVLMPNVERSLLLRLSNDFDKLGNRNIAVKIFQGMVTSANSVYHLHKTQNGFHQKFSTHNEPVQNIENTYLRPLVTGPDAKRYQTPDISTYLIFPYDVADNSSVLSPLEKIKKIAPATYELLKKHETLLRNREHPKMDRDDKWWGYVYPKNQVEQANPKIMLASTATEIRAFADPTGKYAPDDRRVYSVVPTNNKDLYYLLGLLNGPLHTFLLKKWARPKANCYYDIETQFLAPLPIPDATEDEKAQVAEKAKNLQCLHTMRRDLMLAIDKRFDSSQCEDAIRDESWLWADVKPVATLKKDAPPKLKSRELTAWAQSRRELMLNAHLEGIDPMLLPGVKLTVSNDDGELKLLANGASLIEGVFLSDEEAAFISAQWRQKVRRTNVTEKFGAKKLISLLLKLRKTDNQTIKEQVVQIDTDIRALDEQIAEAEADMNRLTYRLYKLTDEEIRLVEM